MTLRPAAIGDVDGDGVGEIVTRQLGVDPRPSPGQLVNDGLAIFAGETLSGMPALVDIDFDGDLEIAVGTIGGKVYLMHHDFSDYSPGVSLRHRQRFAGDGRGAREFAGQFNPELVFSQLDGTTHIVFEDGDPGVNYPNYTATNDFVYMPPIVTNVYGSVPRCGGQCRHLALLLGKPGRRTRRLAARDGRLHGRIGGRGRHRSGRKYRNRGAGIE